MKYRCRPGIVRVSICGEYLLVPSREAYSYCQKACRLTIFEASLWEDLEKGKGIEEVCKSFGLITKNQDSVRKKAEIVLKRLVDNGYLIEENTDTDE